jgi:DNA-directed RNA polymerase subunit RPC12/RpoP
MEIEMVDAYKCQDCDEISEEVGGPVYECGNCGTQFTREGSADGMSHRCPDCGKFGSKVAEQSCTSCDGGEVEQIEASQCSKCGTLYEDETSAEDCCS